MTLWLGIDTPVRNTLRQSSSSDKRKESGATIRTGLNDKRGMKFAHVNISTLLGHFAGSNSKYLQILNRVWIVLSVKAECVLWAMFATERIEVETEVAVQCL